MATPTPKEGRQAAWERALEPVLSDNDVAGTFFRLRGLENNGFPVLIAQGMFYETGGKGVPQDYEKARQCFEKALEHGPYVLALLGLGRLFFFGRGVPRDYDIAHYYYSQLEENEEPVALLMLGLISCRRDKDLCKARHYFERSMELGNLIAEKHLTELDIEEGDIFRGWLRRVGVLVKIIVRAIRDRNSPAIRTQ